MATVSLDDDAPLGPNDFRVEIDEDVLARIQAKAAANGRAWETLVLDAILALAGPSSGPDHSALGAARPSA